MAGMLRLQRRLVPVILVAFSAAGCTEKTVNAGDNGEEEPVYAVYAPPMQKSDGGITPAWKLVDKEWDIVNLAVDGRGVFWIAQYSRTNAKTGSPPRILTVQSCDVASCRGSLHSINVNVVEKAGYAGSAIDNLSIVLNKTNMFWLDPEEGAGVAYSSRIAGGAVNHLNPVADSQVQLTFGVDDTYFYFAADERYSPPNNAVGRCAIDDCNATVSRLPMTAPFGEAVYGGTSRIVPDGDYLYLLSGTRIIRTRKDGTDDFEVIAREQQNVGTIVVRRESIFWTVLGDTGQIRACPISGCSGDPRPIASNLRTPFQMAVDGDYNVYFTDPVEQRSAPRSLWLSNRLLRCRVADCTTPTVVAENQGITGPIATDAHFVYFPGNDGPIPNPTMPGSDAPSSYLAVVRR